MRDWDRNGRIDARDHYIFHEIIMKENEADHSMESYSYCAPAQRRSETKNNTPKKKEKMSGYEIVFWVLFGIMALIGLFVD